MEHLSIDLETMGTEQDAPIIAIGACFFCPLTGKIGDTFHTEVSLESSMSIGCKPSASTIMWWLEQDEEARSQFTNNDKAPTIQEALCEFTEFIGDRKEYVKPWGNGARFDIGILYESYKRCYLPEPWGFRKERDVRTIVDLAEEFGVDLKKEVEFVGVEHNALDDAIHQSKYVSVVYNRERFKEMMNASCD